MASDGEAFVRAVSALHEAEVGNDRSALLVALAELAGLADAAPLSWYSAFEADAFCSQNLLAPTPAAFWKRLVKQHKGDAQVLDGIAAAIPTESVPLDMLGIQPAELVEVELSGHTLTLREGSYLTGGIGRHVYAAAMALATLFAEETDGCPRMALPSLRGKRVLELGSGLGLVGLAAAKCFGASSVLLTDYAEASVECAAKNAALNGLAGDASPSIVRSACLDWNDFGTPQAAKAACERAALGGDIGGGHGNRHRCAPGAESHPDDVDGGWWPDVIVAADVVYSEFMGDRFLEALASLLAASPPSCKAVVVNGWPNRGLARFEKLIGAREVLAAKEKAAREAGEAAAPRRPFVDQDASGNQTAAGDANAAASSSSDVVGEEVHATPRGLSLLRLEHTERVTGFADHAHHVYVVELRA